MVAFRLEEGEAVEEPEPDATLVGPTAAAAGLSGERVREETERSRASLGGAASVPPSAGASTPSRGARARR